MIILFGLILGIMIGWYTKRPAFVDKLADKVISAVVGL